MSDNSLSIKFMLDFIRSSTKEERVDEIEDKLANQSVTAEESIDVIKTLLEETSPGKTSGILIDNNLLREVAAINLLVDYDIDLAAKLVYQFCFKHELISVDGSGMIIFKKGASKNFLNLFFKSDELRHLVGEQDTEQYKYKQKEWSGVLLRWLHTYEASIKDSLQGKGIQNIQEAAITQFNESLRKCVININVKLTSGDSLRSKSVYSVYEDFQRSAKTGKNMSFKYYYSQILIYCNLSDDDWSGSDPHSIRNYQKGLDIYGVINSWVKKVLNETTGRNNDARANDIIRLMRIDLYSVFCLLFRGDGLADQTLNLITAVKRLLDITFKRMKTLEPGGTIADYNGLNRTYLANTFMGTNAKYDDLTRCIELQSIEFRQDDTHAHPVPIEVGSAVTFNAAIYHNTATYTVGTVKKSTSSGSRNSIFISYDDLNRDDLYTRLSALLGGLIGGRMHNQGRMWVRVRGYINDKDDCTFEHYTCANELIQEDSGFRPGRIAFHDTAPTYGNYRLQVLHYISLGNTHADFMSSVASGVSISSKLSRSLWPYRNVTKNVVTSGITRVQYVYNMRESLRRIRTAKTTSMITFRQIIPYNLFTVILSSIDTMSKILISSFASASKEGGSHVTISTERGLHSAKENNWWTFKLMKVVSDALTVVAEIFSRNDFQRDSDSSVVGDFLSLLREDDCNLNSMDALGDADTRLLIVPSNLQRSDISTIINFIYTTINSLFVLGWWRSMFYDHEHLIPPLGRMDSVPTNTVEVLDYILWSTYTATGLYTSRYPSSQRSSLENLKTIGRYFNHQTEFRTSLRSAAFTGDTDILVYEHTFNMILNIVK